jgi:nicotinamidase-related amidase
MRALLLVDVQNEFSAAGLRPVATHGSALAAIRRHVAEARRAGLPIAWVRHHNKPGESPAFVPGSWGAELSPAMGPLPDYGPERLFEKDVYGAFTGTGLDPWLRGLGITEVLVAGFYTHMCLSTSVREALVRGFDVVIDPDATGARALDDPRLGRQSADEVRRTALLQLVNMGATLLDPADAGGMPVTTASILGSSAAGGRGR